MAQKSYKELKAQKERSAAISNMMVRSLLEKFALYNVRDESSKRIMATNVTLRQASQSFPLARVILEPVEN